MNTLSPRGTQRGAGFVLRFAAALWAAFGLIGDATAQPTDPSAAREQALQRQIEALEQQVQDLKKAKGNAPSKPAAAPAAPAGGATGCFVEQSSGDRYCPGWTLRVVTDSPSGETVVGEFAADTSRVTLADHKKHFSFDAPVVGYRGIAIFVAKAAGNHTFSMRTESDKRGGVRCQAMMQLGNEELLASRRTQSTTLAGSRDLEAGPHEIQFAYFCRFSDRAMRSGAKRPVPFAVLTVLTPSDSSPRAFRKDELVHRAP